MRRLLAGYPNLNAHDPEGYVAALVQTMEEFPQWAGERAILRVDEENKQFPPTEKVMRSWLTQSVQPYRFAVEWDERVAKQIAERPAEEPKPTFLGTAGDGGPGTIYSDYEEAARRHGRPTGPFEDGREHNYED